MNSGEMRVSLGKIKMTIPEKDNRNGNNKKKQVPPRQPEGPVYVIIDGNNLVKYVFDLNHQPVEDPHLEGAIVRITSYNVCYTKLLRGRRARPP